MGDENKKRSKTICFAPFFSVTLFNFTGKIAYLCNFLNVNIKNSFLFIQIIPFTVDNVNSKCYTVFTK